MKLIPFTAFWNKQYKETDFGAYLASSLQNLSAKISELSSANGRDLIREGGVYFADDLFVPLRNLGFLDDPLFVRALGPRSSDRILMARIWRIWITSWSLRACWNIKGDIVDLGTYNGKAMYTACKYSLLAHKHHKTNGRILLADLFENPPVEARKSDHSSELHQKVHRLFTPLFDYAIVVKGSIPTSLLDCNIKSIAWAQIDLNSAKSDLSAIEFVYNRLQPGAHVIFDDYGFQRYKKTQEVVDSFFLNKMERVLELPTGQGLVIKA
jgi:O-methyltransferase